MLLALIALALLAAVGVLLLLQERGITPRALAPYVEKRSSGHNGAIVGAGKWSAATLMGLDRGAPARPSILETRPIAAVGVQPPDTSRRFDFREMRHVDSADALRQAIASAAPGDIIALEPGVYRFTGAPLNVSRPGTAEARILVRAAAPGSVKIEFDLVEGFIVSAPYWGFENLDIRGACQRHQKCEHAFHVTGAATHFEARNNTIVDFNAHFKINGVKGQFPDHGRIEFNTLRNDSVRATSNPVTPIDLVAASHWSIRRNMITDFIKGQGDRISYGAFAKGGGVYNVIEQNVVLCEARLRGSPGQRVGLSLGGGATGKPYCRDGKCIVEQERGVLRANLVASCSDDGIYLNNAADSEVTHNTVVDTGGIQVRFAGSSAGVAGNLVDGAIRARDGALLREHANLSTPIALQYLGYHPQRGMFRDAAAFDFRWKEEFPERRDKVAPPPPDVCGTERGHNPVYGAFDDIEECDPPPTE